ncbi:FAD-dependent oxidoreductase [Lacticigenium naphthae]|uniref:FAD-dependent oxidoreductase n=1 Tax=Lacticigenium naphthae TaxID=515351 RepID=UPI00041DEE46|nr:FAD-dependent oxidoreductase [Lacticigenium naphthae]
MKIVVIGSVAAGTSVAAKARRNTEEAEIVVYDKGKDISYSVCGIPYYLGGEVETIDNLIPRDEKWFKERFQIDIHTQHEVLEVNADAHTLTVKNLQTNETITENYDRLVLATGASPYTPAPFELGRYSNLFQVRSMEDARQIQEAIERLQPKKVVIVGAGFIGLEMTEQLIRKGLEVTIVQLEDQVMPQMDKEMAFHVEEELRNHNVTLQLADTVATINGNEKITQLTTTKGKTLETDLVILATGVRPNTQLGSSLGAEIGSSRALKVDKQMRTNIPNVFAVGDVAESFSVIDGQPLYRPLGSTANKMGRIAGDVITGGSLTHRGVLGTGIFRIFDLHVAQTGLTEKEARAKGYAIEVLYNIKPAHAKYLGGKEITIKALVDKKSERILGAQIVGPEGVDKRIDVLATAISFKAKAEDLFHLDLAYAPPFATTKDPILYTGMALDNALKKNPLLTASELMKRSQKETIQIIDTRSKKDYEKNHVAHAQHIPLADLRDRLSELDPTLPTVVYCNKGVTGNAAQNLLHNKGFKEVYNLSGGNKTYQLLKKMQTIDAENS